MKRIFGGKCYFLGLEGEGGGRITAVYSDIGKKNTSKWVRMKKNRRLSSAVAGKISFGSVIWSHQTENGDDRGYIQIQKYK